MGSARKSIALVVLACASAIALHAQAVSIQVLQHDRSTKDVRSSSFLIEEALMDFFFDDGIIASTIPAAVSASADSDASYEKKSVGEAREGHCDYLVVLYAEFDTSTSRNPTADILDNIAQVSWKVFNIEQNNVMATGSLQPRSVRGAKNADIASFVRGAAAIIARQIRQGR